MSLQIGDRIPAFTMPDQTGAMRDDASLLGRGPFVVFFYPKDDTPGCTVEACTFRDEYAAFTDAGAEVYGVSADSPESHTAFAAKHRLPYTLLTDEGRRVGARFGVTKRLGILPGRVTFVFDSEGRLRHRFTSDFNMKKHVTESLEVIRGLAADARA